MKQYSNTLRLMPQNYLVGYPRYKNGNMWIADVDHALSDKLAVDIFRTLRDNYFEANADHVVNELNKLLK